MKQYDFDQLVTAFDLLSPGQHYQLIEPLQHPEKIPVITEHLDQQLRSYLRCPQSSLDQIHLWDFVLCIDGHLTSEYA